MATRIAPSADVSEAAVIGEGTAVWHLAQVRERAVLGQGCIVGRGAYIGEGVRMGRHCKVQNYALVYEPAVLADGVFIGPAVTLTNDRFPRAVNPDGSLKSSSDWEPVGVTIEEGASIGARAVCVAPVRIGAWATVAAGAVVTSLKRRTAPVGMTTNSPTAIKKATIIVPAISRLERASSSSPAICAEYASERIPSTSDSPSTTTPRRNGFFRIG